MSTERIVEPAPPSPAQVQALVDRLLPPKTPDRQAWVKDIQAAFGALELPPSADNICAVLAVTEQESTFRVNPAVPGLAKIAWAEIDSRARALKIPVMVARAALRIGSPDGRSYAERIDAATTEQALSDIFEDLVGLVPMGKTLFGRWNPVRTGGPMQVSIAFAEQHAQAKPYPFSDGQAIRDAVFTRLGGMYFGIAHLLDYPATYDRQLYRFADFNAGHYASRNAAFQNAVSVAAGTTLALDGDLVSYDGEAAKTPGNTELATRKLKSRLSMSDTEIRRALEAGRSRDFEQTPLYRRVFELAERESGSRLPRAVVPRIRLKSPKITRNLTTAWFADRVEGRYRRCLARDAAALPTTIPTAAFARSSRPGHRPGGS